MGNNFSSSKKHASSSLGPAVETEEKEKDEKEMKQEDESQQRMKEMDEKIASNRAETEATKKNQKEKYEKEKKEFEKLEQERQIKLRKMEETQEAELKEQAKKREEKSAKLEEEHQEKLKKIEAETQAEIIAAEEAIEEEKQKQEERMKKVEEERKLRQEASIARLEEHQRREQELKEELLKAKESDEKSYIEWKTKLEAQIKNAQDESKREMESRKKQDEELIIEQKRIKEEEEIKAKGLAESLKNLKEVVAVKNQEMKKSKANSIKPMMQENQTPIQINTNQLQGISDVVIPNSSQEKSIAVIGLPKTGRSTLVGALAGGISPNKLSSNPIKTIHASIYKLNYPNNGFINGSIEENQPIYDEFFNRATLSNLSFLLITIDGNLREEDFLVITLVEKYKIPMAIIRTKFDEWLDNKPENQSKEEYVENDKNFILTSLKELDFDFPKNHIYNVSALALINMKEDGPESDMKKYEQDEKDLLKLLNLEENSIVTVEEDSQSFQTADVVVAGLKRAGKSTFINWLNTLAVGLNIIEYGYDETMIAEKVIKEISSIEAKLYLIIITNTVGNIDAKLTKYFVEANKVFSVVLNRSDEMLDNLKKQKKFTTKENYIYERHEAANRDFKLLNLNPENIPAFTVSGLTLMDSLNDDYVTEEQKFIEFVKHLF